jgi:uncharacterized protein (TIGR02145 family)
MRYLKFTTILLAITCLVFPFNQASALYASSFLQTSDTDFNLGNYGTQTALDTGNGRIGLSSMTCGQNITYNGDIYSTVLIGTQCWLGENLRTTQKPDGSGLTSYCNPDRGCLSPWGRLYNWNVAMNGASAAGTCGAMIRGICPSGWHIPSDYTGCTNDDFYLLSSYLGGDSVSGGKMKTTGTTYWNSPNTGATNISGFSAVGAGWWDQEVSGFDSRGDRGHFWTSSQSDATHAMIRYLSYNNTACNPAGAEKTRWGYSVRCVKDNLIFPYYSSGTYTSSVLPAGGMVSAWGNLSWTSSGTGTITMKARSCSTSAESSCVNYGSGWSACSDFSGAPPLGLKSATPNNCVNDYSRFIQYQATLNGDTATTPYLESVALTFDITPDAVFTGALKFLGSVKFW